MNVFQQKHFLILYEIYWPWDPASFFIKTKGAQQQQQQSSRNTKLNIMIFDCHITNVWAPQQNFTASEKYTP